jgi:hypothetical protein
MRNTYPNNIFDDISPEEYIQLVRDYNPQYPMKELQKLVQNYRTPTQYKLRKDTENLCINQLTYDTLNYIITKCWICPTQEQYKACIVGIYKMHIDNRSLYQINKAKNKMIQYLINPPQKQNTVQSNNNQEKYTSISYCPCCKFNIRLPVCN